MNEDNWHFWIDRGGTFTDVIGRAPGGELRSLKLLSENPAHYVDAAAEGIRRMLAASNGHARVAEIRMGTTVATNALLERTGAQTGLIVTRGFRDVLAIGNQDRPRLFDLQIRKPAALYASVAEVDGRMDADGVVLEPLDTRELPVLFAEWRRAGIESVAICLLHAWRAPAHEAQVAELARSAGFQHVYASHEVSPLLKLVSRAGTTVSDAYLSPVLLHYVAGFRRQLAELGIHCDRIFCMQSNGGLVSAEQFRGKDAVLSGPAGGVIGMQAAGARANLDRLIGFDMGGTSTDVSVCAGQPEIVTATEIAGVCLRSPMIRIHTIAAGGGSILRFDRGRFQAGPDSAGAVPGPLSYGHGGPLALTDANLLLGRLQPAHFPSVFGADGTQPLDLPAVRGAFVQLAGAVSAASEHEYSPEETAEGFLRVAIENMANALRHISVSRGLNPADYTLCCFGGAGGQHACRVADRLGIRHILLDPHAGVLSAWGMGAAACKSYRQHTIDVELSISAYERLHATIDALEHECTAELQAQGLAVNDLRRRVLLDIKSAGTDSALTIELGTLEELRMRFDLQHRERFGFDAGPMPLWLDTVRVEMTGEAATTGHLTAAAGAMPAAPAANARVYLAGAWLDVPVYERSSLKAGTKLAGPALITEEHSTTVLEASWMLTVNAHRQLMLERPARTALHEYISTVSDPVMLEIFNNHFVYIADEMGTVLQKTARSVNIKERQDFSCALFTANGDLIANAPHVPVHLGSMDTSVKTALREHGPALERGDAVLTNAPYNGGTHLPDVTIISPVLDKTEGTLRFIVASRAHHADLGGISPGSMPPFSTHVSEEGILFDNVPAVVGGQFAEAELRAALLDSTWPARNPDQNIADFRAQIAANARGRRLVLELLDSYGPDVVAAYAQHVQDNAEASVREVISELGEGAFTYPLDNGQQISVRVHIDPGERAAVIDFAGTSAARANNLNAPSSVCQAAVMYVFRTLVQADIPLNAGCRKPLQLLIPPGSMLDPAYPAAVVGGNVETSQCITDALYGALGVLAGSQGTMNNFSFGNERLQYYETICGGAGAGSGFAGAHAVQTHMTNTRITDPEVLEVRYPVLLREFSVRKNSGGSGKYTGGDGVVRKVEFRETMSAAILSNHREVAPFGLAGGKPGKTGRNLIERSDGRLETYGGTLATEMHSGDVLIIMTPGGGGFGTPPRAT